MESKYKPSIVFCTTVKNRTQHLRITLPRNLADNLDYPNCKFVILDYGSQDDLLEYLRTNHAREIESGKVVVYGYYDWSGPFRMAHAKNMAHRCGMLEGADILVNMDADNYSDIGFATWVSNQFEKWEDTFCWCNAKSVVGRARQGLAGRVAVSRHIFMKVGGYDEKYIAWAPEDEDFKTRVRRLGFKGKEIENRFLFVLPHKDALRFSEYPDAKPTPESEAASLKKIWDAEHVVANDGVLGCGVVYELSTARMPTSFSRIDLNPLPTRVFGIGMHKTATTSLYRALKTLGLDSWHWKGPWWAKNIWNEMQNAGRSLTIEQCYAVCDLPIGLLYEQLDKAYPGSKFILTLRDEEKWLKDVKDHWDYASNVWRKSWDIDCFTHRMHWLLYGRKMFDADIFLARYRKHNEDVLEYFKHRQNDLLVMHMDHGAGWSELCPFLNMPIPNVSYPFVESTRPEPIESMIKDL